MSVGEIMKARLYRVILPVDDIDRSPRTSCAWRVGSRAASAFSRSDMPTTVSHQPTHHRRAMLHPTSVFARFHRIAVWLAVSLVAGGLPSSSLGQSAPAYKNVTNERLTNPEPRNWLMYRGSYDSKGYSALDQINTSNVSRLVPAWTFSTGMREGHQAPPIVNEGVMFVTTPHNRVLALDARSGDLLWRYDRELPEDQFQMHPTNRGVALYADRV